MKVFNLFNTFLLVYFINKEYIDSHKVVVVTHSCRRFGIILVKTFFSNGRLEAS